MSETHNSTLRAMSPYASTSTTKKPAGISRISLPSYDTGIDRVPEDQIALVHEGEKVVPADENPDNGAPVDFAGRVLPNPRGLRPILDTDIERPSDTDRLPKGVKASTDNAPLITPAGDTSNPPATEAIPAQGRLISTDQGKQKAAQTVQNPGAQTTTASVPETLIPTTEEKPTKGGALADQYLKHIGIEQPSYMPKRGTGPEVAPPGMPKINTPASSIVSPETLALIPGTPQNRAAMPVYGGPGAKRVAQGELIPEKQLPQDELKYQLSDLKQQRTAALAERTPEGQEKADRIAEQIQELQKNNPWGSAANHPGVLGKIGHVAEMVASRAPGIAPIMATLPGSEVYRAAERAGTREDLAKDTQLTTQRAAEEGKGTSTKEWQEISGGAIDPKHPELGAQPAFYNKNNPDEGIKFGNVPLAPKSGAEKTAPATADQVADYQQRIANSGLTGKALEVYGNAPKNATAAELDKRFDEATKLRGMDQKDQENMINNQARKDAAAEHTREYNQNFTEKQKGKYYSYVDKDGKVQTTTGDKLPEDADEVTPIKDFAVYKNDAAAGDTVQQSLNRIRRDVEDHPEIFDNSKARAILGNAVEDIQRSSAGILVSGTGGSIPIPAGFGAAVTTALQNHALDEKTADALRTYIADYKAAKDKAIVQQMALQGGKIGRGNATALKAIIDQLPNGDTPNAKTARRQLENLQQTQDRLMDKYPEEMRKEKPYQYGGGKAGKVTVQTPQGSFEFNSQTDADAFKKKAGL